MGTNYYLYQKQDCERRGRHFKPLHIGTSFWGWCFSLHVIPEDNINDLDDWQTLWNAPGTFIRDEHGEEVTISAMEDIITRRCCKAPEKDAEWYWANRAEPGPNNLVRSVVDGQRCIKHGAGTWDCIVGEFS